VPALDALAHALPGLIKAASAEANFQATTVTYTGGSKAAKGKKGKGETASDDDSGG
jgi:hypothetical protein